MIERRNERLLLSGAITFADALAWRSEVLAQLDRPGLVLDLAGVTEADSAAVSLLLEWRREAKARGFDVTYANLPASIVSLAELYGVSGLIPSLDRPQSAPAP